MKVLAVIPHSKNSFQFAYRQISALKTEGVEVEIFLLKNRMNPFSLILEFFKMRRLIWKFQPDLIHAHYGSITSFFSCMNFDVPVVVTFRGSDINANPSLSFFRMKLVHFLSNASSKLASHVFCVSQEIAGKLLCDPSRISILPSGVEDKEFFPIKQAIARVKTSLGKDEKIILFNAGRNPNLKRLDIAEKVYQSLKPEFPTLRLLVLNGMTFSAEIPYYMNSADVVLMSSESEGSPNIVKEAASCGVPVVSFDVGDVSSILFGSQVSRVVANRDVIEMVNATRSILKSAVEERQGYLPEKYKASYITSEILKVYSRLAMRT
ncbi:MAG: glycosyltransferase [Bdellovibrionota bacterium]